MRAISIAFGLTLTIAAFSGNAAASCPDQRTVRFNLLADIKPSMQQDGSLKCSFLEKGYDSLFPTLQFAFGKIPSQIPVCFDGNVTGTIETEAGEFKVTGSSISAQYFGPIQKQFGDGLFVTSQSEKEGPLQSGVAVSLVNLDLVEVEGVSIRLLTSDTFTMRQFDGFAVENLGVQRVDVVEEAKKRGVVYVSASGSLVAEGRFLQDPYTVTGDLCIR